MILAELQLLTAYGTSATSVDQRETEFCVFPIILPRISLHALLTN